MSKTQRALLVLGALLYCAVLRFAWIARITHDEGYMLDVIRNFGSTGLMEVVYNGRWGTRWVVTIGPTVSLPPALIGALTGVHVLLCRMWVVALCTATFYIACRLLEMKRSTILICAAMFLLWVGCGPWIPYINPSSFNLISNVFGEGAAFAFAALANILAFHSNPKLRGWAWSCAVLAVGSKLVAALAVIYPLTALVWRAVRGKDARLLGLQGMAVAIFICAAWQSWQLFLLGWEEYLRDWNGFLFWAERGGGLNRNLLSALLNKWNLLAGTYVNPGVILMLFLTAIAFLRWTGPLIPRAMMVSIAISTSLYLTWFVFLSSRGWMRHLWVAYALFGFTACAAVAKHLEAKPKKWLPAWAFTLLLLVTSLLHGSLSALGPLDEDSRWRTQEALAKELSEKYPDSRVFVHDWRNVPHIAFFMRRPPNSLLEIRIRKGDLILCDREPACPEELYAQWCKLQPASTFVSYCIY